MLHDYNAQPLLIDDKIILSAVSWKVPLQIKNFNLRCHKYWLLIIYIWAIESQGNIAHAITALPSCHLQNSRDNWKISTENRRQILQRNFTLLTASNMQYFIVTGSLAYLTQWSGFSSKSKLRHPDFWRNATLVFHLLANHSQQEGITVFRCNCTFQANNLQIVEAEK